MSTPGKSRILGDVDGGKMSTVPAEDLTSPTHTAYPNTMLFDDLFEGDNLYKIDNRYHFIV
jgi:hypothetical protein